MKSSVVHLIELKNSGDKAAYFAKCGKKKGTFAFSYRVVTCPKCLGK